MIQAHANLSREGQCTLLSKNLQLQMPTDAYGAMLKRDRYPNPAPTNDQESGEERKKHCGNDPRMSPLPVLEQEPRLFASLLQKVKADGWDNLSHSHKSAYFKEMVDSLFDVYQGGIFSR